MSENKIGLSQELVVPIFESNLFSRHSDSAMAVGKVAIGSQVLPGMEEEFKAYLRLRANVYAFQTHMLPVDHVSEDGTETDENDDRSVHIAVVENAGKSNRLVGAMRVISKLTTDDRPLPIEESFPEAFQDTPAPVGSVEISRFICRHEDPVTQRALKWPLYTATAGHIVKSGLHPSYAVIEEFLEHEFERSGVPTKRLSEPLYLERYKSYNIPAEVDIQTVAKSLNVLPGSEASKNLDVFTFFGTRAARDGKVAA